MLMWSSSEGIHIIMAWLNFIQHNPTQHTLLTYLCSNSFLAFFFTASSIDLESRARLDYKYHILKYDGLRKSRIHKNFVFFCVLSFIIGEKSHAFRNKKHIASHWVITFFFNMFGEFIIYLSWTDTPEWNWK